MKSYKNNVIDLNLKMMDLVNKIEDGSGSMQG
jgi:hypothetical protein